MNYVNTIIIFTMIVIILTLLYYYYVVKYINELKDIELCNKLNSPYLNIYIGIVLFYIMLILISYTNVFGRNFYFKYIFKNTVTFTTINIIFNLFIIYLLYNISSQEECKDIQPNFRLFLIIMNIISFFLNIKNIYKNKYKINNKELKEIKKYLKKKQ